MTSPSSAAGRGTTSLRKKIEIDLEDTRRFSVGVVNDVEQSETPAAFVLGRA